MKTNFDFQKGVKEVTITLDYDEYITLMELLHQSNQDDHYPGYQDDLSLLINEFENSEKTYVWDEI